MAAATCAADHRVSVGSAIDRRALGSLVRHARQNTTHHARHFLDPGARSESVRTSP